MNKIGFALSGILTLLGAWGVLAVSLMRDVMPLLGRVAFQAAMAGSYSPQDYRAPFTAPLTLSILFLLAGIILSAWFFLRESRSRASA